MNSKDRVEESIKSRDYKSIVGEEIGVDNLQSLLEENGFISGNRGRLGCWYENVVDDPIGYIAVLEAVEKGTYHRYLFTVEAQHGPGMVAGVKRSDIS